MQTGLADFIRDTPEGAEADAILRKCVHCGFCTATCPTYQILGDDLDSPRGRIYLIKRALEGAEVTARTRLHLDRCLTCRACETTCPSGVRYGRLVDIGRRVVEERTLRTAWDRLQRAALSFLLPRTGLFAAALSLGRLLRPFLPRALKAKIPLETRASGPWPAPRQKDAGARRLRPAGTRARYQRRGSAGSRPARGVAPRSARGRLLRRYSLPPQSPGTRAR